MNEKTKAVKENIKNPAINSNTNMQINLEILDVLNDILDELRKK